MGKASGVSSPAFHNKPPQLHWKWMVECETKDYHWCRAENCVDTETYTAPDQECWRRKEIPPTKLAVAHTSVGAHHDRTFTITTDPEVQHTRRTVPLDLARVSQSSEWSRIWKATDRSFFEFRCIAGKRITLMLWCRNFYSTLEAVTSYEQRWTADTWCKNYLPLVTKGVTKIRYYESLWVPLMERFWFASWGSIP